MTYPPLRNNCRSVNSGKSTVAEVRYCTTEPTFLPLKERGTQLPSGQQHLLPEGSLAGTSDKRSKWCARYALVAASGSPPTLRTIAFSLNVFREVIPASLGHSGQNNHSHKNADDRGGSGSQRRAALNPSTKSAGCACSTGSEVVQGTKQWRDCEGALPSNCRINSEAFPHRLLPKQAPCPIFLLSDSCARYGRKWIWSLCHPEKKRPIEDCNWPGAPHGLRSRWGSCTPPAVRRYAIKAAQQYRAQSVSGQDGIAVGETQTRKRPEGFDLRH